MVSSQPMQIVGRGMGRESANDTASCEWCGILGTASEGASWAAHHPHPPSPQALTGQGSSEDLINKSIHLRNWWRYLNISYIKSSRAIKTNLGYFTRNHIPSWLRLYIWIQTRDTSRKPSTITCLDTLQRFSTCDRTYLNTSRHAPDESIIIHH